ncbi:MAG TPA: hypothetical protein ENN19_12020, partial [Chloroflexi bacterium]|nr:hypothetical protein [Chloroflexota bacterium]
MGHISQLGMRDVRTIPYREPPGPIPRRVAPPTAIAYDMVIVGLVERGRLRRWLRGPSTRRILQYVSAPVLV